MTALSTLVGLSLWRPQLLLYTAVFKCMREQYWKETFEKSMKKR